MGSRLCLPVIVSGPDIICLCSRQQGNGIKDLRCRAHTLIVARFVDAQIFLRLARGIACYLDALICILQVKNVPLNLNLDFIYKLGSLFDKPRFSIFRLLKIC